MKLHHRLKRLERLRGETMSCARCHGRGGPMFRVEFENGDEPVEGGRCRACNGQGSRPRLPKSYVLPGSEFFDCV